MWRLLLLRKWWFDVSVRGSGVRKDEMTVLACPSYHPTARASDPSLSCKEKEVLCSVRERECCGAAGWGWKRRRKRRRGGDDRVTAWLIIFVAHLSPNNTQTLDRRGRGAEKDGETQKDIKTKSETGEGGDRSTARQQGLKGGVWVRRKKKTNLKWRWQKPRWKKRSNIRRHSRCKRLRKPHFLWFFCVRVHVAPLSECVCGEREDERGVGDIFELATQKPITTGCSLTASFLTGSFTARTLFIHHFSKDETGGQKVGGEAERDGRHPVSRPCCLARMCAAMRRRQPRDRIDYDFVSADNEAVTSTEPRAQRRGRGASQHFPPVALLFSVRGREAKKISLKSPTFCIYHQGSAEMAELVQSRWW